MRSIALSALAVALTLAACATTPRQQCEAPYRAELRNTTFHIRETEMLLRRGFGLVPARNEIGLHYCLRPTGSAYLCRAEDGEPMFDRRPINRVAEQAKLDALRAEARRLTAAIADCQAAYPE
ncbi:hypothetical protein [Sinisalibacter aestuarii]|uniref:Lipoprotein n=1 Tax=Sinisalibacter aestuarii TaxID=2949426 RepID=A0ABQ5LP52_9RHOB|nr:hypothetical protein [Sinisalibacter aestuarii]GKY86185.1 hypothetical protein STA1M1_00540 [Sinisalibacter aestuarii]